jgi:hypothetical protein
MNIIEEHRAEVRIGINTYSVEVALLLGDDQSRAAEASSSAQWR